jgi:8-oxo-dGTP pyrophosphatase MutT (NUDIX family)
MKPKCTMQKMAPEPRPSASVILVRDAPGGLETFMVRRHARSPVMPDAYVFPGGTVREDDRDASRDDGPDLARRLSERSDDAVPADQAAALFTCAVREVFEEAGVLLVHHPSGELLEVEAGDTARQERWAATRLSLQARELSLSQVVADGPWLPSFERLVPFSHWVTPAAMAARFDTWFFVASMPEDQEALHDTIETSDGAWLRPRDALSDTYYKVFATAEHLRRLQPFSTVAELLVFARGKRIVRVQPAMVETATGVRVILPESATDGW